VDFFDRYRHAAGIYHTPARYHSWAAMSLVSAALGDRVYLDRFRHVHLYPNLFVFLVGPSGIGKDHAVGFARSLLSDAARPFVNPLPGRLTQAILSDLLVAAQKAPEAGTGAPMWLIQSELFADLPGGDLTKALVSDLVRLYQAGHEIVLNATRMHGVKRVERGPVINWLAGSTPEWFTKAITPDLFDSGFSGRSVFVVETRNYERRFTEPIYPDDYEAAVGWLRRRVERLCGLSGAFTITDAAVAIEQGWVYGRSAPQNDVEAAMWDRQHVLSLKLAMILAAAETMRLTIEGHHMAKAQEVVEGIQKGARALAMRVHQTPAGWQALRVRTFLRQRGAVKRATLIMRFGSMGIHADEMDRIVATLIAAGEIDVVTSRTQGKVYRWIGMT
jgi:hypothetical protein